MSEIPKVCRKLRTKTSFNADPEGELWKLGNATTEAYWCLETMEPFGPDGNYCHPHVCGETRSCYRAADDAGPAVAVAERGPSRER
jgi:hypothetical protein